MKTKLLALTTCCATILLASCRDSSSSTSGDGDSRTYRKAEIEAGVDSKSKEVMMLIGFHSDFFGVDAVDAAAGKDDEKVAIDISEMQVDIQAGEIAVANDRVTDKELVFEGDVSVAYSFKMAAKQDGQEIASYDCITDAPIGALLQSKFEVNCRGTTRTSKKDDDDKSPTKIELKKGVCDYAETSIEKWTVTESTKHNEWGCRGAIGKEDPKNMETSIAKKFICPSKEPLKIELNDDKSEMFVSCPGDSTTASTVKTSAQKLDEFIASCAGMGTSSNDFDEASKSCYCKSSSFKVVIPFDATTHDAQKFNDKCYKGIGLSGDKEVTVPDLVGLTTAEAEKLITAAGLKPVRVNNTGTHANEVINQIPAGFTSKYTKGEAVILILGIK